MLFITCLLLLIADVRAFRGRYSALMRKYGSHIVASRGLSKPSSATTLHATSTSIQIAQSHYDEVIPFLSEHIQKSDQMLVLGAASDFPLKLMKEGYGTAKTGFMFIIDENSQHIDYLKLAANDDEFLAQMMKEGKLKFAVADYAKMPEICRQSVFDSNLLKRSNSRESFLSCIDNLQNSLRLGNVLVCLSKEEKTSFTGPFEERFGKFIN